jgi:hypothetical protein
MFLVYNYFLREFIYKLRSHEGHGKSNIYATSIRINRIYSFCNILYCPSVSVNHLLRHLYALYPDTVRHLKFHPPFPTILVFSYNVLFVKDCVLFILLSSSLPFSLLFILCFLSPALRTFSFGTQSKCYYVLLHSIQ